MSSAHPPARTRDFDSVAHHSRLRVIVMALVGVLTAVLVGVFASWAYAPSTGWAVACLVYLLWVWIAIRRLPPAETAAYARREDPGRLVSDVLVLAATVASFGGVALVLLEASKAHGFLQALIVGLALLNLALSWFVVHTLYALRYARLYYRDRAGVDFNENVPPRYLDFAYLAFTVGMTFQVSDTDITTVAIRRTIIRHALLSYLLGVLVLACTVNLVSGLLSQGGH